MSRKRSISQMSLDLTGMFEAELLVILMLEHWKHPLAADREFAQNLLESAAEVLRASVGGDQLITELEPQNVNLVAAICYAESVTLAADPSIPSPERPAREGWVEAVRRSVPSCFCDPDLLG
jgi:hypothetical protein